MHPIEFNYTPVDDSATGYASAVGGTPGVAFVLAATTAGDSLAHPVTIAPSAGVTGNYTLTGTDADGIAQTETLPTNAAATVTSVKFFKTLTEVLAPSGIGANTVNIGWSDVGVGATYCLNWRQPDFQVSLGVVVSGTINYTVQHCLENIRSAAPSTLTWWPHASLVGDTTSQDGNYASPVTATRILINSLTAGATLSFQIIQGD